MIAHFFKSLFCVSFLNRSCDFIFRLEYLRCGISWVYFICCLSFAGKPHPLVCLIAAHLIFNFSFNFSINSLVVDLHVAHIELSVGLTYSVQTHHRLLVVFQSFRIWTFIIQMLTCRNTFSRLLHFWLLNLIGVAFSIAQFYSVARLCHLSTRASILVRSSFSALRSTSVLNYIVTVSF